MSFILKMNHFVLITINKVIISSAYVIQLWNKYSSIW